MRPKRLFISYAHSDEAWCSEFVDILKKHGIDTWFDRHELDTSVGGPELEHALSAALESCDLLIMVYSPASRTSLWVAWELLQRQTTMRLVLLHNAPVGMVGAFVRCWANYGVYDAGHLPASAAAVSFIPHLDKLRLIANDVLQGLLTSDRQAEGLWQLNGYKRLIPPPHH